ncbi:MAG TPA: energy transducer TonB [Candidatus Acidoferrales bacterium]
MSTLAATRPSDSLTMPFVLAVLLHISLLICALLSGFFTRHGDSWGGPGGAISVGLVGSVPAIPLPRPAIETPSRVVGESRGLYKAEPPPKVQPPPPDAVPIPKFKLLKPVPKYVTRPSKILENPTPPPPNAVPYGHGGTPTVPTTSFAMGSGTQAGLALNGVGGGDFGARFAWYVQAVQQRISRNWLQSTVDPGVSAAPRVVVTFDILRDGAVTNIQVTQSSNIYSVDSSAVRAVQNSSPLTPLPAEYSGSKVSVEFWFDFRRQY